MKPTCKEIFENGQVLTLGKAKELTGKYVYVTNAEYWANEPTVRRVLVSPISEWDAAAKDHTAKGFDSRQEYWKSYMTEKQIERTKNCFSIGLNELGNLDGNTSNATDDTPFFGSDEDREIYYIEDKNQSALPQHGQAVIMKQIYYNDGVDCVCVHECSTLEEAKVWIAHELKGRTMVDDDHQCSEDVLASAKTALYEVYDGEPIIIKEHGEYSLAEPIYESDHFYTE